MFDKFINRSKEETSLLEKSTKDFKTFNSTIENMHSDTAFEKTKVELVLTADKIMFVLDNRLHSPLTAENIQVVANFIKLEREKKNKTKKEVVEEAQDELESLTDEDLEIIN